MFGENECMLIDNDTFLFGTGALGHGREPLHARPAAGARVLILSVSGAGALGPGREPPNARPAAGARVLIVSVLVVGALGPGREPPHARSAAGALDTVFVQLL